MMAPLPEGVIPAIPAIATADKRRDTGPYNVSGVIQSTRRRWDAVISHIIHAVILRTPLRGGVKHLPPRIGTGSNGEQCH
jgi:hypothetical protein